MRLRAAEQRQSTGALQFDQYFESFVQESTFVRDASQLLGDADQIVVEFERSPHAEIPTSQLNSAKTARA